MKTNRGSRNANIFNEAVGFGVLPILPAMIERPCGNCIGKGWVCERAYVGIGFRFVMVDCPECKGRGFKLEPF